MRNVLSRNKREEIGFNVGNLRGRIIVKTKKVLEMFECVDKDVWSLRVIK